MKNEKKEKKSDAYYEVVEEIVDSLGERMELEILELRRSPEGADHFIVSPRDGHAVFDVWVGDDWIQMGDRGWGARGRIDQHLPVDALRLLCCDFDPEWESRMPMLVAVRQTSTGTALDLLFASRSEKRQFVGFLARRESQVRAVA